MAKTKVIAVASQKGGVFPTMANETNCTSHKELLKNRVCGMIAASACPAYTEKVLTDGESGV